MNEAFTIWEILLILVIALPFAFIDKFFTYRKRRKLEKEALYWAEVRALRCMDGCV